MEFDPLPQQRRAIAAPLGPVLVVAGPGAGSRHHEDGAEGCCDGAALLGQGVELHAGESRRRGAERLLKQPFPRSRRLTGKPSTRLLMLPGLPLLAAVTLAG